MTSYGGHGSDYDEGRREPGARRRKLAGYLKAANELRQAYTQQYTSGWGNASTEVNALDEGTPGAFPDAAVVRSGNEEMQLFPSYARRHIKRKPQAEPGTIQEAGGQGRDARDATGVGDAEFWRQQWEQYEDDNAVVDVDVRGWLYTPHKGALTRKHRLFIGLARQLVGLPAPSGGGVDGASDTRGASPHRSHRERAEERAARRDEELVSKEADNILKKGEQEAEVAQKGGYSERPTNEKDSDGAGENESDRGRDLTPGSHRERLASKAQKLSEKTKDDDTLNISPLHKRASWNQPADMSPSELSTANQHLMQRLKPFLAYPLTNTAISAFFYNDEKSVQKTIYTNPSGQFTIRAALDFIPTHVRVLVGENLSATEPVIITEAKGISVISDIDDTIKHTDITMGAREIFRNAFIRNLDDLTIEGVREWYNRLAKMGVKFHYVSNSPWQIYPMLSKFFALAKLPPGSFHLKQYSGMLQGIFEPVAERKKGTLDRIAHDFPERKFILVGDSGEADLEVYTDFVLENPGRVLGVFIRDVTTPQPKGGFFDPSVGQFSGQGPSRNGQSKGGSVAADYRQRISNEDEDPDLKAAIAASLRDMELEQQKVAAQGGVRRAGTFPLNGNADHPNDRPQLPPRTPSDSTAMKAKEKLNAGNLIDFSDDEDRTPPITRINSNTHVETQSDSKFNDISQPGKKRQPPPPKKPANLRSVSANSTSSSPAQSNNSSKPQPPPPPKPRRPSSIIQNNPSRTSSSAPKPEPPSLQDFTRVAPSYTESARQTLSSAYNRLPSPTTYVHGGAGEARSMSTASLDSSASRKTAPPPPPPPRRNISSYPAAAAQYASDRVNNLRGNNNNNNNLSSGDSNPGSNRSSGNFSNSSQGMGGGGYEQQGGQGGQPLDKKVEMWRRRWERAEKTLTSHDVVLRSWRVGRDVEGECVRLVERALKQLEKEEGKEGSRRGSQK